MFDARYGMNIKPSSPFGGRDGEGGFKPLNQRSELNH